MLEVRMLPPCAALQQFVRVYAQRTVSRFEQAGEILTETIPARLEQTLEFQFGERFDVLFPENLRRMAPEVVIVGGYLQHPARIELRAGVQSFAVFFCPTGLSRLLGIPVSEFTNINFDATLLYAQLRELRIRLAECSSFEHRVRMMEGVLLKLATRAAKKDIMTAIAEHAFSRHGAIRVAQLADQAGLGRRQFERKFFQTIGVTPKLFTRVARFQTALDAKILTPDRSWLQIAHDLHYHDQMHMIHDFQELTGDSPAQLIPRIGDGRPTALIPDDVYEQQIKTWP
jgi:AraC-like DNA-binding protein